MNIQYLRTRKHNHKGTRIVALAGVMVAFNDGDKLKFGFSLLNPVDAKAVEEENVVTRKKIAEMKKVARCGKAQLPDAPKLKPVFDKKEAIRLAEEKAVDIISLDNVPKRIRKSFYVFCRKVIANYHAPQYFA